MQVSGSVALRARGPAAPGAAAGVEAPRHAGAHGNAAACGWAPARRGPAGRPTAQKPAPATGKQPSRRLGSVLRLQCSREFLQTRACS